MNLLVLHTGALGDCALTLHLVAAMKQAWGDPPITLVARSPLARWAKRYGLVADARSLDQIGAHRLYAADIPIPDDLREFLQRFDRMVSFLGGAEDTVTDRLSVAVDVEVLAIDPKPAPSTGQRATHITEQWADRLAGYGHPVSIHPSAAARAIGADRAGHHARLAHRLGLPATRPIALCHPGSGGLDKCCPIESLEYGLRRLREAAWSVAWTVGPDEIERFGDAYIRRLKMTAPVLFEESVDAAADLVLGSNLYVGHDAGMTHLAALSGVPTIAIFGPTDPRVWGPLGPQVTIVRFPTPDASLDVWVRTWHAPSGSP